MNVIEATGLKKRFGTTQALDGVDLAAREGTVLGVLGPNGAGKTTAVRMLATLLQPDAGTARVGGYDVVTRRRTQVRRTIGLTGQYASVDEDLTGIQNLVLIGQLLNLSDPRRQGPGRGAAGLVRPGRRRAAGRPRPTPAACAGGSTSPPAWSAGRAVIFLDEPTTGLDPAKREDMWEVVRRLVTDGSTVLLTTQYLEEADALADEITRHRPRQGHRPRHPGRAQAGHRRPADRGPPDRSGPARTTCSGSSPRSPASEPRVDRPRRAHGRRRRRGGAAAARRPAGRGRHRRHRAVPAPAEPGRGLLDPHRRSA